MLASTSFYVDPPICLLAPTVAHWFVHFRFDWGFYLKPRKVEVEQVSQLMAATSKKRKTAVAKKYVPPELVGEILLYLPCKSLDRFKCVSKLFASFLHDSQFISVHRKRNLKPSHYLTWDTSDKTKLHVFSLSRDEYRHVKTISTQEYRVVLSSSYGLVCILGYDSKRIALLNPVSGKLVAVTHLIRQFAFQTENQPGAPEPTSWRTNYTGFGFDLKSQKYKIVQFVRNLYTYDISRCHVLTVDSGRPTWSWWREIDVSYQSMVKIYFQWLPIYVDGVLYWEKVGYGRDGLPIDVFAFDLSNEKITVFESKSRFNNYGTGKHLTTLQGKLCCTDVAPSVDMTLLVMKIWKLGGYGHDHDHDGKNVNWILWYKLDIPGNFRSLYPLYMDDEKRVICETNGDLYCYDIHSKRLEIYPVREKVEGVAYSAYSNLSTIHSETVIPIPLLLRSS